MPVQHVCVACTFLPLGRYVSDSLCAAMQGMAPGEIGPSDPDKRLEQRNTSVLLFQKVLDKARMWLVKTSRVTWKSDQASLPCAVARVEQLEVVLADGLPCGFKGFALNSPALKGFQQVLMHQIGTQTTQLTHLT